MKQFAGIAAIAFAAHAGFAWAQPVIVGPGDSPPGRAERPSQREAPMRAPAEAERGPQRRMDAPGREGRDAERSQVQQREQTQREQTQREQTQRERSPDPSAPRARPEERARPEDRDQAPNRNQAQREQPENRTGTGASDRAQRNGRSPNAPETAQPQQPQNPAAPTTARPGSPEPNTNRSNAASPPQGASPQPQAGTQPPSDGQERRNQASGQTRPDAESQRIADTVRERVDRNEIRPVRDFGVSVTVGAQLPSRVELQPLPSDIAALRPQYRNYRYTVSDREIVIVDPGSRRVVEVIDRDGARAGGSRLFTAFERQRDVRRWRRPNSVVFEAGVVLPSTVPLHELPVEVVEEHPDWRGHRYVVTESDEIAVVEPRTHRIVQVIDKDRPQSASSTTGGTGSRPQQAASDDRRELVRIILQDARPGEIQGIDGLKGAILPSEFVLRPLPAEAEERDEQLRGLNYTLIGDDVLIVEPLSRRVVDVIE